MPHSTKMIESKKKNAARMNAKTEAVADNEIKAHCMVWLKNASAHNSKETVNEYREVHQTRA